VAVLAEKGLISGVYITSHNIVGSTAARLKEEISALQEKRRAAGLPPLIVAADQEGGIVSHQRNICTAVVERSMPVSICCWSPSTGRSSIASLPAPWRRRPKDGSTAQCWVRARCG
jgi:hypothetical protein